MPAQQGVCFRAPGATPVSCPEASFVQPLLPAAIVQVPVMTPDLAQRLFQSDLLSAPCTNLENLLPAQLMQHGVLAASASEYPAGNQQPAKAVQSPTATMWEHHSLHPCASNSATATPVS